VALIIAFVGYPIADGLKEIGRGSDQDDAIINAGLALIKGYHPYSARTYLNILISPGPGWILFALPFIILKTYYLFSPVIIIITGLILYWHTKSWHVPNLFIILLSSSLICWGLLVEGSDLIPLGCILAIFLLLLSTIKLTNFRLIILSITIGMVATSRISFIYLPLLYAVLLYTKNRKAALTVGVIGTLTALCFHLGFYLWSVAEGELYKPIHLLTKGNEFLPGNFKLFALLTCLASGLTIFIADKNNISKVFIYFWLGIFTPLFFVSMGDLFFNRNFSLTLWEGANYLVVPLPAFLIYILLIVERERETVS
jgi:hypothetical protein